MKKLVIIDEDGNKQEDSILDELFLLRESELKKTLIERNEYIKEHNLKEINQNVIIEKIKNIPNINIEIKEDILASIDKLLDNRLQIQSFDCKLYYKAGIRDIINIIFNDMFLK